MLRNARLFFLSSLVLAGNVLTAPSQAQDIPTLPECTCRANGHSFKIGENVCLGTPNGPRMAQCELTQNVTNWRFLDKACDVSGLTPLQRQHRASLLAACPRPV